MNDQAYENDGLFAVIFCQSDSLKTETYSAVVTLSTLYFIYDLNILKTC